MIKAKIKNPIKTNDDPPPNKDTAEEIKAKIEKRKKL